MPRLYSSWRGVELAEILVRQDLGEADDRVERGAQLVGDVGDELALETVGCLQRLVALAQRALDASRVGDIEAGQQHVAVGQRHRRDRNIEPSVPSSRPLAGACAVMRAMIRSRIAGQSPASL